MHRIIFLNTGILLTGIFIKKGVNCIIVRIMYMHISDCSPIDYFTTYLKIGFTNVLQNHHNDIF